MSTILFATNYDEPTEANSTVAERIAVAHDVVLLGVAATREALIGAINAQAFPLFVMAHGSHTSIYETHEDEALGVGDCHLVEGRTLFAWACNTAKSLGRSAADAGGVWLGYDCLLTAPEATEPFLEPFANVFRWIKDNFHAVICAETASAFLNELHLKCVELERVLDALLYVHGGDLFGPLSCCRQMWQQLRVWIPGRELPVSHERSAAAYIDF